MLKVGITGSLGSGKTTVCRIFELLGIPVFYADATAIEVMNSDPALVTDLKKSFGDEIYLESRLQRRVLASKVFNDEAALKKLEQIVHPAVFRAFESWGEKQQAPYVLHEAALIYESGLEKFLDKIISVTAPKTMRFARAMQRSGLSFSEAASREKRQIPQEKKDAMADFVIYNDETKLLIPQVLEIHRELVRS